MISYILQFFRLKILLCFKINLTFFKKLLHLVRNVMLCSLITLLLWMTSENDLSHSSLYYYLRCFQLLLHWFRRSIGNSSRGSPMLHQQWINDRQFSSGFFFLVLIYGDIKGLIAWRKWGGDRIDVNRLAVTYLLHVSLLKLWTCKGIWERMAWICIRALDFSTATTELIVSTFLLLYQNLDKDSPSLSGFHAHRIQSTPIQFESSKFWPVC